MNHNDQDYYQELGIPRDADQKAIKDRLPTAGHEMTPGPQQLTRGWLTSSTATNRTVQPSLRGVYEVQHAKRFASHKLVSMCWAAAGSMPN